MRRADFIGLALLVLFMPAWLGSARADNAPVIAAASDLQFALAEAAQDFTRRTGREVKLSFGSSGNFSRQIEQGAPFQLFLSADEDFALGLAAKGLTEGEGALYAIGRIVIFAPEGSPLAADGELSGLDAALKRGEIARFAIANPEHAPYGARAVEALRHAGLWEGIKDKLVLGENASQAAQFAASGNAQGGIIPYSLALAPSIRPLGTFALIPAEWHAPLRQRMALIKGAGETARAFYAYLQGPDGRAILRRYGFLLPGETS
ncbi:MAG TPA: molybdate ABC transporter substrate-binding protein [Methyloceanibacter sp.]|nr:molybdate ABC transporter substrate-binding protein [Methyloceanibacter sp.]